MAEQSDGRFAPSDESPRGAASGEERRSAIEQLVREHHAEVYRYAFRLAGIRADAEDIAQQSFLIAAAKFEQLRDPAKVRAWLYAIARSCFLKSRRKTVPVSASTVNVEIDEYPSAGELNEEVDTERLQWALKQLPDDWRVILNLFYFEDLSYREIADVMEIRIGTVMSRLSRAKDKLRRLLLGTGDDEDTLTPALGVARGISRELGVDDEPQT